MPEDPFSGDAGIIIGLTSISARSRGNSGNAGTIKFSTDGNAEVSSAIDASARATEGNGGHIDFLVNGDTLTVNGSIDFSAQTGNAGTLVIDPDKATVINGNIIGNAWVAGNGGSFEPPAQKGSFTFNNADLRGGALLGNGGKLSLVTEGFIKITGRIDTSAAMGSSGSVDLKAGEWIQTGNIDASAKVNAGHVRLSAAKTSIQTGTIKVDSVASNAGFMHLQAGGNISTKTLTATAPVGQAGAIVIEANKDGTGNSQFVIGGTGNANGINGNALATGRTTGTVSENTPGQLSTRSFIAIIDGGTGGMSVARQNSLSTAATDDKGGFIFLSTAKGILNVGKGLSTDSSSSFAPGSIYLDAQQIQTTGAATISSSNTAGGSAGGTVSIATSAINYGTQLDLKANGKTGGLVRLGPAGAITYSIQDQPLETTLNIEFGDNIIQDMTISGAGGFSASVNGIEGGGRMVISARNLTYGSAKAMTLSALGGADAPGGKIELTASSVLTPNARISLYADGEGTGRGGTLEVVTLEALKIDNKLSGVLYLSAKGGDSGSGGTISVLTRDRLDVNGSGIDLESGVNGNGGTLNLKSLDSTLAVNNEFLVEGNGTGKGGQIDLQGKVVVAGPTFTVISANSGLEGDGGLIQVTANEVANLGSSFIVALSGTNSGAQGGVIQITAPEIIQTGGELNVSSRGTSDPGTIVVNSTEGALTAFLNGDLISSSTDNKLGSVNFFAPAETLDVSGSANLRGEINAIASDVDVSTSREGVILSLRNLSAAQNVRVSASGSGSRIDVLVSTQDKPTAVTAGLGEVFLQADRLQIGISPDGLTQSDPSTAIIEAPSINLHARAGDIVLGANIDATVNATLIAQNNITQVGEYTIRTGSDGLLSLQADHGDIFSDNQGSQNLLRINSTRLAVNAGGLARVRNQGEVTLLDASAGTKLEVRSSETLRGSGSIRALGGSMDLISEQGNVEVQENAVLSARGPMTLQAEFGRNSVSLGANSRLETSAGNDIRILLSTFGDTVALTDDDSIANVSDFSQFGNSVQVAKGADNQPDVSRIIGTTIPSAEGLPLGNRLDAIGGSIILNQSVGTGLIRFLGNVTVSAGTLVSSQAINNEDRDNHVLPVSFISWQSKGNLIRANSDTATLTAKVGCHLFEQKDGSLLLKNGEVIIEAKEETQIQFGDEQCRIGKGAVILASRINDVLRIINLVDKRKNSVTLSINNRDIALSAGRELLLHVNGVTMERAARRDSHETSLGDNRVLRNSEVSLPNILTGFILKDLLSSRANEDRELMNRIRKMAACLSIVKGSSRSPFVVGR